MVRRLARKASSSRSLIFGLPKNAPHRENALNFLRICGSKDGQDAFSLIKGSIAARTDADKSKYDEYQLSAMEDFKKNTLVPSIQHGAAAKQSFVLDYDLAINILATKRDVKAAKPNSCKPQRMLVLARRKLTLSADCILGKT